MPGVGHSNKGLVRVPRRGPTVTAMSVQLSDKLFGHDRMHTETEGFVSNEKRSVKGHK